MRIAHITDLHVEVIPRFTQLFNKRAIGAVNLYLLGRHDHFSRASSTALVAAVQALAPDAVVCTGDLTATATPEEYAQARVLLAPLIDAFPFYTLSGNHDVYTGESVGRFASIFGNYSGPSRRFGEVEFLGLDVCHPDYLSRGQAGAAAIDNLDTALAAGDGPAVVMLHYPLRNRHGQPYGPATRALSDAAAVEAVLARHSRVIAVLHGHEHHGYRTQIGEIPSFNPGASGYSWMPERKRTAHFNVYTFINGRISEVERFAFDGVQFLPEAGGAYATGG